ncbi:STM3941 family protein [Terrimonas rubra]|uniref:STM3941 family protein n=1 Tax=Terrimonas rubra TaxID=1035890 RepID=A0ABW6A2G1_9BACT
MTPATTIALSKTKLIRNTLFTLLFFIAGLLFIIKPFWFIRSDDSLIIVIIGYILLVLAGLGLLVYLIKLSDKKPALIIDEEGITDNSSGVAAGKILWSDIKKISVEWVSGQQLIMVEVKNPQLYIKAQKNPLKKSMMTLNYSLYKTPIHITTIGMNVKFEDLYKAVENGFQNYKR